MTDNDDVDLDPQEAIEHGYDPNTDIPDEDEDLTPEDELYVPEPLNLDGTAFDADGWPGDALVIVDLDGIDEDWEGE